MTCNAFINEKYLSNIRDAPDGKYRRVHCNAGVTHTNIFGRFNDQSIPYTYSGLTNDYAYDGTQIDAALMDKKGVEDVVFPNNEKNYDNSLASYIEPPPQMI